MNCTAAYPQDEGAVLMLGYGERSSPCRQRPSRYLRIISRSLMVSDLPKVTSRHEDCFWGLGLMGFDLVYSVTGFHVTPVLCSPRGTLYRLLKTLVMRTAITFERF